MKIAQVIHGFPPRNVAGSEVYTYNLCRQLAKEDDVYVFHRIANPERDEYEIVAGTNDGLKVYTINNTFKYCDSFERTYRNDAIASRFGEFLDEVRPDIVHFGHLTCLSTTLVEETAKRSIPTVFTLHDFWLFCQLGQLLKRDLSLCQGPTDTECARCLAPQLAISGGVRKAVEMVKRAVPNYRSKTGLARALGKAYRLYTKVLFLSQHHAHAQIRQRTNHIRHVLSLVDLFIAPSKFLLAKCIDLGIPRDKIIYCEYGFDSGLFPDLPKVSSPTLRFGFIGTIIPPKGLHVLLEAFNSMAAPRAELRIHGKFLPYHAGFEEYPSYVRSLGNKDNVIWFGEYDNKDLAPILAGIDIVVVPSIWHENSPLVIHEAFMAGVPVITANIGGMAELVKDGVTGLLFEVGDARDLATKMQTVIDDRALIGRLSDNIRPVVLIEAHALQMKEFYRMLLRRKART